MRRSLAYPSAAAAFAAPPLLLVSDILLVMFISAPGLLVQRVALSVFIVAIIGAAAAAGGRAQWQAAGGAALAVVGALAIVIRQSSLAAPIRPPAVLLPLGLLVLSGALIGSPVPRRIAAFIAVAALLFPFAHQSGVPAALIGCDVILLAAFWPLGRRIVR